MKQLNVAHLTFSFAVFGIQRLFLADLRQICIQVTLSLKFGIQIPVYLLIWGNECFFQNAFYSLKSDFILHFFLKKP